MSFLGLVLFILVVGVIVWLIQAYAPIPAIFKQIILWLGIVVVVFLVLQAFGIIDYLRSVRVPRL